MELVNIIAFHIIFIYNIFYILINYYLTTLLLFFICIFCNKIYNLF